MNSKTPSKFIPYEHLSEIFSKTGQFSMQDRSQRDIFFSSRQQKLTKVCQISMVRQPIQISLPVFWTPNFFTKLLKVPTTLLRRGSIRFIIYQENMLLMRRRLKKMLMARGKLIFLLFFLLSFVINLKK